MALRRPEYRPVKNGNLAATASRGLNQLLSLQIHRGNKNTPKIKKAETDLAVSAF
jgi:hypothetical protein